jgi:hypothetical protein
MFKTSLLVFAILLMAGISYAVPRDYVVVEVGTGTWCQYCPGAALGVDDMIANDLRAAIIEYHNGDTFTNTYSNQRNSYYNITGFPSAFFDGGLSVVGGDHTESMYSYYLPKYNQRIAVNSAFTITLDGHIDGDTYTINATVTKVETSTATNLYLRAALTESDISFNWQGQTRLDYVERDMYPNATGTAISFTGGDTQTVTYTFSLNSAWVRNNCELVVFLQNNSTKEIYQGTKYKLAGLVNAFPLNVADFDYGDVVVNTSSTTQLVLNNFWNETMTGTIECDNPLVNINFPGRLNYSIPPFGVEYFNVTCFPNAAGPLTGNIIITSNIDAYPTITIPFTANAFVDNPPTVSDVHVTGIPVVYQILTGNYVYSDIDGDTEGISQYQWYRMESGVYVTTIDNQTGVTYIVQPEDIGKQIIFGVSPKDEHGISSATIMSPASDVIEQLPVPRELTANIDNDINIVLNWLTPNHFGRGLFGYKIYRNGAVLATIPNAVTLTYTDHSLSNGTYEYHVVAIYNNPLNLSGPSNSVTIEITNSTQNEDPIPAGNCVLNAYPNPFNNVADHTNIRYTIDGKAHVSISIYDIKGRKICSLVNETRNAGTYESAWNGKDENGMLLPSGIYYIQMTTGHRVETKKVVLLK